MKEELVTSPRVNLGNRNRINVLTKELNLKKYSNTVGFLLVIYDLLFEGRRFKDQAEMIKFVSGLVQDKEQIVKENMELKKKLKDIRDVVD